VSSDPNFTQNTPAGGLSAVAYFRQLPRIKPETIRARARLKRRLVQIIALLFDVTPLVTISIVSPSCATMIQNIGPSSSEN